MRIAGRDWRSGSIRTSRSSLTLPWRGRVDSRASAAGWGDGLSTSYTAELRDHVTPPRRALNCADPPPPGEGEESAATSSRGNHAPSQRSQTPLLHRRRARFPFPDPESPLRHILRQGRSRPARWGRDRRLCARSLATRAGLPLRCRRAGRVRRVAAQSIHGAGTKGVVEHACADQRAIAARSSRTARQRETAPAARWCRWRT